MFVLFCRLMMMIVFHQSNKIERITVGVMVPEALNVKQGTQISYHVLIF